MTLNYLKNPSISRSRTISTDRSSNLSASSSCCYIECGQVVLSPHSFKRSRKVDYEVICLIGKEEFNKIVQTCKQMYMERKFSVALRSPSKTRQVVEDCIEPYLEGINKKLAKRNIHAYISLESLYTTVLSSHPTYYLSIKRAAIRPQD
mmetsp:Transcript_3962/g.5761  ORF Transcript_3962/g.5761 Transcript_3962/m.5761 type:complete len:149 (-) Transcript_3962:220-666(-)